MSAAPFFSDIFQNINTLLNKDFFHNVPTAVNISTTTKSGLKFNVNGKQLTKDAPLQTAIETRFFDKSTGFLLSQGWTNKNRLNTRIELSSLAPGLKTDLFTSIVPSQSNITASESTPISNASNSTITTTNITTTASTDGSNDNNSTVDEKSESINSTTKDMIKTAIVNVSFVQPFFTAKATFDLLKKPSIIGNLTLAHEGFVAGTEVGYDITSGFIYRYAVALAYRTKGYNVGISINDEQLTTASFFQTVSKSLQVGSKATLNPKLGSNVNVEFATKYLPDPSSQIKAKITDVGKLTLSYKQNLKAGVTLGVGASLDALKLDEPLQKVGWSLSFTTP